MQKIAVLLTVHNRKKHTLACLKGLYDQILSDCYVVDVFLVDDGSSDGTSDAVEKLFPQVIIVKGTGDLYWNQGMRLAWNMAALSKEYDYYLWLNDDTLLKSGALMQLIELSILYDDKAIVIGSTSSFLYPDLLTYGGWNTKGEMIKPANVPQECDYFNGNIVLVPKYVFQTIGMLDKRFRHALGDFDYGMRAHKHRIKNILAPGFIGQCNAHDSFPVWCNPQKHICERWKAFRTPLGHHPEEFFIFKKRHNGYLSACFSYLTNHARVLFPQLWANRKF